ncbi:MAG TPA: DEAD/DEAH box helicase, partial [Gammaproteobacteria bacterium]
EPLRKRGRLSPPLTGRDTTIDFALVTLSYEGIEIDPDEDHPFYIAPHGRVVRIQRDLDREQKLLEALAKEKLQPLTRKVIASHHLPPHALGFKREEQWRTFVTQGVTRLREAGWQVEMPTDFRHYIVRVDAWEMAIHDEESGWLDLDMGIMVEGERLALAPLLHTLFAHDERWLDVKRLATIADGEEILFRAPSGLRFTLPAGRLKPLAATLIDLFDGRSATTLRLPRHDALRLARLAEQARCRMRGGESAMELAERIKNAGQVQALAQPADFGLPLRPYQLEGLAWLQYLREQQLGGILADDMGLGKTAQTLAHLLCEKQAGRLDRPSLIVMPTSLVFNWQREAQRFAPALRVLTLHGKERGEAFALIPQHDLCITTYPLLWRDEAQLLKHDYHYVILDEAQAVKNAMSRAAAVVRKLTTRHHLCITGTPLENHLGELWSQFDFLMPGFLGDSKQFTATWRTPIEKQGNALRRDILAQRVAPFILRRRKEDVASELPPKSIIVRSVELSGAQRDLYETVRSAMDERVRDEIAARGFQRSQIVILDALLKLRQVCCDPRLLKSNTAARVKERAKLELLMEMLPELISEGRRILLFSQFTSMLGLIEEELEAQGIDYVKLTGATRKREEVVAAFQTGAVPVFLISLKAGGVGLNLTAADTVIHYDPWWNPAAENQATDRAHRIGQQKRVFVYKLVVAGSIEEKILALQERKAELAAGILGEDSSALAKFSESDIHALLAPLPSEKKRTDRR